MATSTSRDGTLIISACDHNVFFHRNEHEFTDVMLRYVRPAIYGRPIVLITTDAHRNVLRERFAKEDLCFDTLESAGLLRQFDAQETLSTFWSAGSFDYDQFRTIIGDAMDSVGDRTKSICAYGEMVGILASEKRFEEAIELENMWNRYRDERKFTLLCGYGPEAIDHEFGPRFMTMCCDVHDEVLTPHDKEADARPYHIHPPMDRVRCVVRSDVSNFVKRN